MAHCYDISNIYYKRHAKLTKLIYDKIYSNIFIEKIIENDKYDTVEKLLKLQKNQYAGFLKYIVKIIKKRNLRLQNILQKGEGL